MCPPALNAVHTRMHTIAKVNSRPCKLQLASEVGRSRSYAVFFEPPRYHAVKVILHPRSIKNIVVTLQQVRLSSSLLLTFLC